MSKRTEYDSMGPVEVESSAYYGAQTVRSLHHFKIGSEKLSSNFIKNCSTTERCNSELCFKTSSACLGFHYWCPRTICL